MYIIEKMLLYPFFVAGWAIFKNKPLHKNQRKISLFIPTMGGEGRRSVDLTGF
jgi:hypothetical protein